MAATHSVFCTNWKMRYLKKYITFHENNKSVLLILGIAILLRLIVVDQSLWHDEAITALAVRDHSYSELLGDFIKVDNHPPLYYLTLKLWSSVFGYGEVMLRTLSVIYGVLGVYLVYKIALFERSWKTERKQQFALLAALLLSTSPLHIYYSQEVRMYSLGVSTTLFSVYYYLRILRRETNSKDWIIFGISILVVAMTD